MRYTYKGMAAGLLSATALAVLLMLNLESGFMPELDPVAALAALLGTGEAGGWLAYFVLAAAIGALFAWLDPDLPGDSLRQRGMIVAACIWVFVAVLVMPLAGLGFLGLERGILLPLTALAFHLFFGSVMGGTYGWLLLQSVPLRYRQRGV